MALTLPEVPRIRAVKSIPAREVPVELRVETAYQPYDLRTRLAVQGVVRDGNQHSAALREILFDAEQFSPEELHDLALQLTKYVTKQLGAKIV